MTNNAGASSDRPRDTRWQPHRSGLINFYRYDNQEFHFEQGRLLLRGNNGTGKSRVLALQLPFLLDGEISPDRVEPDGDKAKRFEWNLLMGKHDDRVGYTWIEFKRTAGGVDQYLTIGCGAHAVSGRGMASRWFFITHKRVGQDFQLCSAGGVPLRKDGLGEALADQGQIFTTASSYREEVNHRLFGLTKQRYEALVKLLIELRQPKLSRHLDEKALSAAMSDSLPPVSPQTIQQVGDAMRAMEQDRVALTNLQSAMASTESFLAEYRRYAQLSAIRRAETVREDHNAYENRHRRHREAEADRKTASVHEAQLRTADAELALELAAATGRRATLEGSPQMRSARDLEDARHEADDREKQSRRAEADAARAGIDLKRATDAHDQEIARHRATTTRLDAAVAAAAEQATRCDLAAAHQSAVSSMNASLSGKSIDAAERQCTKSWNDRKAASRTLRELNAKVRHAQDLWKTAFDRRESEQARVNEAIALLTSSEEAIRIAVESLAQRYRQWVQRTRLLQPVPADEVIATLEPWMEAGLDSGGPVRAAVEEATTKFREKIAGERAAVQTQLAALEQELAERVRERDELLSGVHHPPPVPPTRDPAARHGRSGGPFWSCCDFSDDLSPSDRAHLEAALEAAGILDAWIDADGMVADNDRLDAILNGSAARPNGATLRDVLRPVGEHVVAMEAVLGCIGLGRGQGEAWIDRTGHWQLGPLSGRWIKPAAQHIGQTAREAERLRRLEALGLLIAESEAGIRVAQADLAAIAGRAAAADAERADAPTEDEVLRAAIRRTELAQQADLAHQRLAEADQALSAAKTALQSQTEQRDTAAADLGLAKWIERLSELEEILADYRGTLGLLWSTAREQVHAERAMNESHERLDRERQRAESSAISHHEAMQKAAAALSKFNTLQQTIGAAVEQVQAQLREVDSTIDRIRAQQKTNATDLGGVLAQIKARTEEIRILGEEIEQDVIRRAASIDRLMRFTRTALIDITHESLAGVGRDELSVTAAVDLARQILTTLAGIPADDNAWTAIQRSIHQHVQNLTSALQSHDYQPQIITEDDTLVVTAPLHGVQRPMREFGTMLAEEIVNRRSLLTAKELELLENYLIHDVAVELGRLIREADELVTVMNRQLASRPNSTGMTLRFNWEIDAEGPAAFASARRKLLGDQATWSPDDRTALGQFLQEQIDRARESNTAGTWQEQLSAALDYRSWHQFHIERKQNDKWTRLTRRTHGTGSGGEKAIALTIPQFAAAAAYYDSAPLAPRLILLDEAFVGIDADMRGKCMGLLHEFDLDFVMTSEREWGCYPSMPGLAIYQLSARPDIDAIWTSRWVWNGISRTQQEPQPALKPPATVDEEPNGLFTPGPTNGQP